MSFHLLYNELHICFYIFSGCHNRKLDDTGTCPTCTSRINNPNRWGNADLTFQLPTGEERITVWRPDLVSLFALPPFETLTTDTLEDAIADLLPPTSSITGRIALHNNKIVGLQVKRKDH
jgi:hypothetical protein